MPYFVKSYELISFKSFNLNEMLAKAIEFKSVCGNSAAILIYENNFRERKIAIKNTFEG